MNGNHAILKKTLTPIDNTEKGMFIARLGQLRKQQFTQDEVALRAGLSVVTIRLLERGGGSLISLNKMLSALGVTIDGKNLPAGATLGRRLAALRKQRGITQKEMADTIGIAPATVGRLEYDEASNVATLSLALNFLNAGAYIATAASNFTPAATHAKSNKVKKQATKRVVKRNKKSIAISATSNANIAALPAGFLDDLAAQITTTVMENLQWQLPTIIAPINSLTPHKQPEVDARSSAETSSQAQKIEQKISPSVPVVLVDDVSDTVEPKRRRIIKRMALGRAEAKAKRVKLGRKPILTLQQQKEARARIDAGETTRSVARSYNVSQATISRLPSPDHPPELTNAPPAQDLAVNAGTDIAGDGLSEAVSKTTEDLFSRFPKDFLGQVAKEIFQRLGIEAPASVQIIPSTTVESEPTDAPETTRVASLDASSGLGEVGNTEPIPAFEEPVSALNQTAHLQGRNDPVSDAVVSDAGAAALETSAFEASVDEIADSIAALLAGGETSLSSDSADNSINDIVSMLAEQIGQHLDLSSSNIEVETEKENGQTSEKGNPKPTSVKRGRPSPSLRSFAFLKENASQLLTALEGAGIQTRSQLMDAVAPKGLSAHLLSQFLEGKITTEKEGVVVLTRAAQAVAEIAQLSLGDAYPDYLPPADKKIFGWRPDQVSVYYGSGKKATAKNKNAALRAPCVIMTIDAYRELEKAGEPIHQNRPIVNPAAEKYMRDHKGLLWTARDFRIEDGNIAPCLHKSELVRFSSKYKLHQLTSEPSDEINFAKRRAREASVYRLARKL